MKRHQKHSLDVRAGTTCRSQSRVSLAQKHSLDVRAGTACRSQSRGSLTQNLAVEKRGRAGQERATAEKEMRPEVALTARDKAAKVSAINQLGQVTGHGKDVQTSELLQNGTIMAFQKQGREHQSANCTEMRSHALITCLLLSVLDLKATLSLSPEMSGEICRCRGLEPKATPTDGLLTDCAAHIQQSSEASGTLKEQSSGTFCSHCCCYASHLLRLASKHLH